MKTAGAGAAALGLSGCGLVDALSADSERRRRPRNIVLIVIDTLRPDHVGAYGGKARTPNLDALAGESLRFTRVYPEAMATVPARRSIMTAKRVYPFDNWQPWYGMAKRPGWQPLPPGTENLSTVMRRRGYWTAYVSDNPFLSHSGPFEPFRQTWDRYVAVLGQRGERRDAHTVPRSEAVRRLPPIMREEHLIWRVRQFLADNGRGVDETEHAAARVFRWGEQVMQQAGRHKPFLLVVDSFSPHELWAPPRKYLDMYTDSELPGIADVRYRNSDYLTRSQIRLVKATYAACLTMVDTWLGHFMRELKQQGRADDTVVGLISDHGVFLGEHELTGKSDSYLFEELIHVPLMLRSPDGRGAGKKSDYFATTVDMGPTLMSMAGHHPARRPRRHRPVAAPRRRRARGGAALRLRRLRELLVRARRPLEADRPERQVLEHALRDRGRPARDPRALEAPPEGGPQAVESAPRRDRAAAAALQQELHGVDAARAAEELVPVEPVNRTAELPNARQVLVLAAGGTISMKGEAGAVPELDGDGLIADVPRLAAFAGLRSRTVFNKPSAHLSLDDQLEVCRQARDAARKGTGVVVTHGTDSLEETSMLCDILHDADAPIVFTGAIRPASAPGADGPANLVDAVSVAASAEAAGMGVLVCFGGEIHHARGVRKTDTVSLVAFSSPQTGPLGRVTEGHPIIWSRIPRNPPLDPPSLDGSVLVVPTAAGDDGTLARAALATDPDGMVIGTLGAGHLAPPVLELWAEAAERIPVVAYCRPERGVILSATYGYPGSEQDLRDTAIIPAGFLSPQAARMKLLACVAAGLSIGEVRWAFSQDDG